MAHFAISDIDEQKLHAFERINRAGVGWAGADPLDETKTAGEQPDRYASIRAWNEDWAVRIEDGTHALQAVDEDYSIDLKLTSLKREVIHGEQGVSQKGPLPRNASHYYSLSRMETAGRLVVGGESFEVTGLSWMDHEFGTSFLEQQSGWDWFSIQLEDGRDLMMFELHRGDGSRDPRSSGTMIEADGSSVHLSYQDFSLVPLRMWSSPDSRANYPVGWAIEVPRYGLHLTVTAVFDNQELQTPETTAVTYWEGSVIATGANKAGNVGGRGYLEMTGY